MQKHVKIYLKHHDIGPEDIWYCERCSKGDYIQNFDIHHKVFRSRGGGDDIDNLECLCRDCHNKIHNG